MTEWQAAALVSLTRRRLLQSAQEIAGGTLDYAKWFPHGRKIALFAPKEVEGPPLFRDYVRRWLEDKTARIGAGTAYDMKRVIEGKLIPAFGDRLVSTLTQDDVEAFIVELKRPQILKPAEGDEPEKIRKLSNRRVNIILKALRQSLDRAARRGWLKTNPARAVDLLREERVQIDPLSLDEVKLLCYPKVSQTTRTMSAPRNAAISPWRSSRVSGQVSRSVSNGMTSTGTARPSRSAEP